MEARKLLEYYYNYILFMPEYPESEKTDHMVTDEKTYVPYESIFGGECETGYDLYVGKIDTEALTGIMTKEISITQSWSYLCIIKTDKRGYYIKDSFYLSPVVFALAKILKEKNPYTSLDLNLINKANEDFNEFITIFDRKLEYKELSEIFNYVINKLNLSEYVTEFSTLIKERDLLDSNVQDGFLRDLEYIISTRYESENIDNINSALGKVVKNTSPLKEEITLERLMELTSPERNSIGMWPGHRNLSLKEQIIINTLDSDRQKGLQFLKNLRSEDEAVRIVLEYMANRIVERAVLLSRYVTPDEAFKEVKFKENKEYSTSYFIPDSQLIDNNTLILDKGDDFLKRLRAATEGIIEAYGPNPYYQVEGNSYIVQSFMNNKDSLKWNKDIWRKKDNGLKLQVFSVEVDYEKARREFRNSFDKVLKRRDEIVFEYRITHGYQDLLEKVNSFGLKKEELKNRLDSTEASREFKERELTKKKEELEKHTQSMKKLEQELGFGKKYVSFLFKNDPQVLKFEEMEHLKEKLSSEVDLSTRDLNIIINEYHDIQYEMKSLEEEYNLRRDELEDSARRISYYKEKYGDSFSNEEINAKLVRSDITLPVSLWTDEEFDSLRKQLFIEALKLHRAFFNNSRCFKTDAQLFALALEGKITESDLGSIFHELFKVVTMMTPIAYINTDYAPYLLANAEKESILSAIIPEAGKIPLYETFGITERFKNILGFNVGIDHQRIPAIPDMVEENLAKKILNSDNPDKFNISIGDIMHVLSSKER